MPISQPALWPFLIRSRFLVLITVVAWGSAGVAEEHTDLRGRVLGSAKFHDSDFRDARVSYVGSLNGLSKIMTREFLDRWQVQYFFKDKKIFSELLMGYKRWSQVAISQKSIETLFKTKSNGFKTVKKISSRNRVGPLLLLGMENSNQICGVFAQLGDHPDASQYDFGTESRYSAYIAGWICFLKSSGLDIDGAILAAKSLSKEFFLDGGERNRSRNVNLLENGKSIADSERDDSSSKDRISKFAKIIKRSIAVQWEGVDGPIAGYVQITDEGKFEKIDLTLPRGLGQCTGKANYKQPNRGLWFVKCGDGLTASGAFFAHGSGKGASGDGYDNNGRDVKFTISGE